MLAFQQLTKTVNNMRLKSFSPEVCWFCPFVHCTPSYLQAILHSQILTWPAQLSVELCGHLFLLMTRSLRPVEKLAAYVSRSRSAAFPACHDSLARHYQSLSQKPPRTTLLWTFKGNNFCHFCMSSFQGADGFIFWELSWVPLAFHREGLG